jgi:tRNA nucleotidyltransferase/poly(A) polymerase
MRLEFGDYIEKTNAVGELEQPNLAEMLSRAAEATGNAVVKPLVNAAVIEPIRTLGRLADGTVSQFGAQTNIQHAIKPLHVETAAPFSGQWYLQSVSAGLGSLVPYTVAGKTAGAILRRTGSALAVKGSAAAILKNEHAAFVAGAFAYDGLRPTHEGETHWGNALGGAAGFVAFGTGNEIGRRLKTTGDRLVMRAVTGVIGADLHALVSTGISQNRLITEKEMLHAGIGGGTMNVLLPTVQNAITRAFVGHSQKRGGAWLDQYLEVEKHGQDIAKSSELKQVAAANPWARVKIGTEHADFRTDRNRVELPASKRDAATLGRELHHLSMGPVHERGFQLAQELLIGGNTEAAWNAFRQLRIQQETNAHTTQHKINNQLTATEVLAPEHLSQEMGAWPAPRGVSYEQRWRQEFHQFQQTNGGWRPGHGLASEVAYRPESARPVKVKPDHELTVQERKALTDKEIATEIVKELQKKGFIAVLAGGAVRDEAMGLKPKDYDVATSAPPDVVHQIFAEKGSYKVDTVGKQFGIVNVVAGKTQIEIASLRNDGNYTDGRRPDYVRFVASLFEDSARRDLTINAMFNDPVTNTTYDFHGGQRDIQNKQIRTVGDPNQRFAEDKLRMMRVPRFAARFDGFTVHSETAQAITKHAPELVSVAPERLKQELSGILTTRNPVVGLNFMMDHGLMKAVIPEVLELRGPKAMQDPVWHPEGLTWNHTRMVLDNLVKLRTMPGTTQFELMMAGLLHDVAKPATQKIWPDGGISNHGHAELGAKMAKNIASRLKLSTAETDRVVTLIELHMKMHHVDQLGKTPLSKLLENPYIEDLKALQHADATGTGRADGLSRSKLGFLTGKQRELTQDVHPAQRLFAKPLVDGELLMSMGLKPSKRMGEIKNAAMDAQREGAFNNPTTAQEWLLKHYNELKPPVHPES